MENNKKKTSYKAHTATIMVCLILGVTLFTPLISAWEFDNVLDYKDGEMNVTFTNAFGLGAEIGTIELKSHKSVDEIRHISVGDVGMWYEFNFKDIYENGLGEVEIINIKTSQRENKNYTFVYAVYENVVKEIYNNKTFEIIGKEVTTEIKQWLPLTNKDIPKGNVTIGIIVDAKRGDHYDAVWEIIGKKIDKHAEWDYRSITLDLGDCDAPRGVGYFSGNLFVSCNGGVLIDKIVEFNTNATLVSSSCDISGDNTDPLGMGVNGSNFWVIESTSDEWHRYDRSCGNPLAVSYNANCPTATGGTYNIDDGFLYLACENQNSVQKYNSGTLAFVETSKSVPANIRAVWWDTNKSVYYTVHNDSGEVLNVWNSDWTFNTSHDIDDVSGGWGVTSNFTDYFISSTNDGLLYIYEGLELPSPETTPPSVINNTPTNITYTTITTIFNITATDGTGISSCWYSLNNGVYNYSLSNATGDADNWKDTNSSMVEKAHKVNFYCNDTLNNVNNSESVDFNIDTTPTITIRSPTNLTNTTDTGLDVNYSYTLTPQSCWYSKDRGVTNNSLADCTTNITTETWVEGLNTIFVYINNSLNNQNRDEISFSIDTTDPVVNILTPTNTTYTTNFAENNTAIVYLNWSSSDTNIDSCWYRTNNSVNMSVTCGNNQTLGLDYGSYLITTCANDSVNHVVCDNISATWNYALKEGSTHFNATAYETSSQQLRSNVTSTIALLSLSANLYYNGTSYPSVVTCVGTSCNLTNVIDLPLVYVGKEQNNSFYWEYTASDGTTTYSANTSTSYQNVSRIYLQDCNTTIATQTLNYTAWVEKNLTKLSSFDYQGTYNYWMGSGSVFRNYSSNNNSAVEHKVCISPSDKLDFITSAQIRYSSSGYVTRDYYFYKESINNVTEDIKLLLLPTGDSTSFIVKVIDSDQLSVTDAYVYVYKYDVGTGLYNIAEISVTDASGNTISHFEEDVADYKIIIKLRGVSVFVGTKQKIFCEELPCSVTFQLTGDANTIWSDFGDLSQLTHSLEFNAGSNIWNYTYIDLSGDAEGGRLFVYNLTGNLKSTICNKTSAASSATLLCDVSDQEGQTYAASYINRSPEILLNLKSAIVQGLKEIFGQEGLFLSMFVLLILGLAGLWNPAVGIILEIAGMIMLSIMGIASFGAVALWGVVFIGAILLWELKT